MAWAWLLFYCAKSPQSRMEREAAARENSSCALPSPLAATLLSSGLAVSVLCSGSLTLITRSTFLYGERRQRASHTRTRSSALSARPNFLTRCSPTRRSGAGVAASLAQGAAPGDVPGSAKIWRTSDKDALLS